MVENRKRIEAYDNKLEEVGLLGGQRSAHCCCDVSVAERFDRKRMK